VVSDARDHRLWSCFCAIAFYFGRGGRRSALLLFGKSFKYNGWRPIKTRGESISLIICAKCGAANKPEITECRMCSNPLDQPDATRADTGNSDSLNTTVVFKNLKTQHGTASLMECLICPDCQTINHLGWLFCPQCGKQVDSSFLQTMERVDQAPTMVGSVPASLQSPLKTVVAQSEFKDAPAPTERPEVGKPVPSAQPKSQPSPPAYVQPQSQQPAIRDVSRQQPPEQTKAWPNNSNGSPYRESPAPPADQRIPVYCSDCGADNDPDYSFCLNCGATLPVTKTIVMASISHPTRPRLRLLVKGEDSGPTYEIKNEASIGRTEGTITFPHDGLMSSHHARILKNGSDYILVDEASSNGTFIRIERETKLEPGDVILVGGQLLRFEA